MVFKWKEINLNSKSYSHFRNPISSNTSNGLEGIMLSLTMFLMSLLVVKRKKKIHVPIPCAMIGDTRLQSHSTRRRAQTPEIQRSIWTSTWISHSSLKFNISQSEIIIFFTEFAPDPEFLVFGKQHTVVQVRTCKFLITTCIILDNVFNLFKSVSCP